MEMKGLFLLVLFASSGLLGQASLQSKGSTCTPKSSGDISIDDLPATHETLLACGDGGTIVIPAGETFMIRTLLEFTDCHNCDF